MKDNDLLFWHTVVWRAKKRHHTEWLISYGDEFASFRAHGSNTTLSIARQVIEQPGRVFTVETLGYTECDNGPAMWRRRFLNTLTRLRLNETAAVFDRALDGEDGTITFRPRGGVRFVTQKTALSVIEYLPSEKTR